MASQFAFSDERKKEIQEAYNRFLIDKFDGKEGEWDYWIQRLETQLTMEFLMDDSSSDFRRNILLKNLDKIPFQVVSDRFHPETPISKSYDELKHALQAHYGKKTCVMAERLAFQRRYRRKNESISQYLNELRSIAGKCRFGQSLNERLRDQLVVGINDQFWQQELLRQHPSEDATLQDIEKTASILEQASMQQQRMQKMVLGQDQGTEAAVSQKQPKQKQKRGGGPRPVTVGITNVTVQQNPGQQGIPSMTVPPPNLVMPGPTMVFQQQRAPFRGGGRGGTNPRVRGPYPNPGAGAGPRPSQN